jgi:transcriptional antiterminator RfaH
MTAMSHPNWYAVQTQPHAEMKAFTHLARQGFEVYLPRFLKRRRHAGRVDYVSKALFPGYLFVAIDIATQRWRYVNSTVGVRKLVCNGEAPAVVDGKIIECLVAQQDDHGFIKLDTKLRFAAGDVVRVIDGIFSTALGIYEGMTDRQRVGILLDILGRKVRVQIDIDSLVAA